MSVFDPIESVDFSPNVTVASDLDTFLFAARQQPEVQLLLASAKENPSAIVVRLRRILEADWDRDYQHPFDVAIALYLYSLSAADARGQAADCAKKAVDVAGPWLWWARLVADDIMRSLPVTSVTNVRRLWGGQLLAATTPKSSTDDLFVTLGTNRLSYYVPTNTAGIGA